LKLVRSTLSCKEDRGSRAEVMQTTMADRWRGHRRREI